jgi:hypothetical protein
MRPRLAGTYNVRRSWTNVYRRYRTLRRRVSGEGLSLFNAKPNLSGNSEKLMSIMEYFVETFENPVLMPASASALRLHPS